MFRYTFDDQLCLLPQHVRHAEHVNAQLFLRPLRPLHGEYGNISKTGNSGVTPLDMTSSGVSLLSMDQFSITGKNKVMFCVEKQNRYCFKYLVLLCIRKQNFANVTHRKIFGKNIFYLI